MSLPLFESLYQKGFLSDPSMDKIRRFYAHPRKSVRSELQAMLYLGVLLVSGGVGVLVYKNIDRLGHLPIVLALLLATLACYAYCWIHKKPFSRAKVESDSPLFDYLLLLGGLLLLVLVGYLQSQFQFFGSRWGLASFIPMCLLFATAYFFDHRGVLAMAITNLAAWLGFTINQNNLYGLADLDNDRTIFTACGLGIILVLLSFVSTRRDFKKHFSDTYHQFGSHIFFIAAIAGLVHFNAWWPLWLLVLALAVYYHLQKAFREKSFYYVVIAILYGYAGASYIVIDKFIISAMPGENELYAIFTYLIISGIGLARLLIHLNRKIKSHDRLPAA